MIYIMSGRQVFKMKKVMCPNAQAHDLSYVMGSGSLLVHKDPDEHRLLAFRHP